MEAIYLFNIGDKIVYPSQGVGIINVIEKKMFSGKMQNYYKINLLNNNLKITIPSNRLENSQIRLISDVTTLDNLLNNIDTFNSTLEDSLNSNCKERMVTNTLKFKSGTLIDYAEVIYTLTEINRRKPLTSSEKQMLKATKKFLIEEISLAKDITTVEATSLLDNSLLTHHS